MDSLRVDLFLKWACLVRHRADATEACRGGIVKVNGQRIKPAGAVRVGDTVEISGEWTRRWEILAIPERQLSKEKARTIVNDLSPPRPVREKVSPVMERDRGAGRPTKKERREIERLRKSFN